MADQGRSTDDGGNGNLGLLSVASIGIGGMVGGGIFAVLGLAVELAEGGAPVAFLVAGTVALLTAYSYAKLSVRYPSQGGTIVFLNRAFGRGWFAGGTNTLLWLGYVVMLALYAQAFGSYGASFFPEAQQGLWKHGLLSAIVVLLTALNAVGAAAVGKLEEWIVALKLLILVGFVGVGAFAIEPERLAPSEWAGPLSLVAGGMVIFLAYEGFELIANTAEDVAKPKRTLPRAYYGSVLFVIALYIAVAAVTVGTLSLDQIADATEYALAAAAKPFLGQFGFGLIAVAAMISTASAINATLYGASRVSYIVAKDGELPEVLEKKVWNKPVMGLLLTAAATLVAANLLELGSISTLGSASFLVIFALVGIANLRLRAETGATPWIAGLGALACVASFATLVTQTVREDPSQLAVLGLLFGVPYAFEAVYRKLRPRDIDVKDRGGPAGD